MRHRIGCLLIHGFGGKPEEVEPLAIYLKDHGITTLSAQLEGHTGKKDDLRGITFKQWIKSGESALYKLSMECRNIFVIGFSMGGLVAVSLPPSKQIKGIVTLNTPIYPWNLKGIFKNLMKDIKNGTYEHFKHYFLSPAKLPFSAFIEFLKFLHYAKPKFKSLHCPLLVAQALKDDVIQPKSAEYIHTHAGSLHKILKYYNGSDHFICYSPAAPELFKDIWSFIKYHCYLSIPMSDL